MSTEQCSLCAWWRHWGKNYLPSRRWRITVFGYWSTCIAFWIKWSDMIVKNIFLKIKSRVCSDVNANWALYLHAKGFLLHNEDISWENLSEWIYFGSLRWRENSHLSTHLYKTYPWQFLPIHPAGDEIGRSKTCLWTLQKIPLYNHNWLKILSRSLELVLITSITKFSDEDWYVMPFDFWCFHIWSHSPPPLWWGPHC